MKILSGRFRSIPIPFRPSPYLRPTPDKVRLAVMATLGEKIAGAFFLDLYCGTGAVGLEAWSRGAARVVFVEKHKALCAGLEGLLAKLAAGGAGWRVVCADAADAAGDLARDRERFDVVFADPPYEKGMAEALLRKLNGGEILAAGAIVVLEARKNEALPDQTPHLRRVKCAVYGDTSLHYYRYGGS